MSNRHNERKLRMQAVDLEKRRQMKEASQQATRSNMYSIATSILVNNANRAITEYEGEPGKLTKKELVAQCLELAQEHFRQINELDQKLVDQEAEKTDGAIITG